MSAASTPTTTQSSAPTGAATDVLDIGDLFASIWKGKWLILIAVAVGLTYGLRVLKDYEPVFEAQMVVMPITQQQSGGASLAGAGLQSLGISLGARTANNFDRFQMIFESHEFARLLEEKHGMLRKVFRNSWNAKTSSWDRPQGTRFGRNEELRAELRRNNWREPSAFALARFIKGNVKFRAEGQFHRISFQHSDREFALWFLGTIYAEAESVIRNQDAAENAQRRQYLEEQLRRATVIEVRQSLAQLISNEERQAMMTQGNLPYVGRVTLAPNADEQPIEPEFIAIFLQPLLAGVGLSVLVLVLFALFSTEMSLRIGGRR